MSKKSILEDDDVKPYSLLLPEVQTSPFIFSSPHSGRFYPDHFLKQSKLAIGVLRSSEDAFIDDLFGKAPSLGAELITATYPRAFIDLNRKADEIDDSILSSPLPFNIRPNISERVEAGFGIIPKVVAFQTEIYKTQLDIADILERIARLYDPYHGELKKRLAEAKNKFGWAALIDCHSMPSFAVLNPREGRRKYPFSSDPRTIDIVLGDGRGKTCDPRLMKHAEHYFKKLGYHVVLNNPYAGGYCTRHYGKPNSNMHALQIEINRGLYMDEGKIHRRPKAFRHLKNDLSGLISSLSKLDLSSGIAMAAE